MRLARVSATFTTLSSPASTTGGATRRAAALVTADVALFAVFWATLLPTTTAPAAAAPATPPLAAPFATVAAPFATEVAVDAAPRALRAAPGPTEGPCVPEGPLPPPAPPCGPVPGSRTWVRVTGSGSGAAGFSGSAAALGLAGRRLIRSFAVLAMLAIALILSRALESFGPGFMPRPSLFSWPATPRPARRVARRARHTRTMTMIRKMIRRTIRSWCGRKPVCPMIQVVILRYSAITTVITARLIAPM